MRAFLADAGRTLMPARGHRHGPLPPILLALTFVTGVVDAVSYLRLEHVFVANMTGNTVFIGFGLAGASQVSVSSALVAMGSFLLGAAAAGLLCKRFAHNRGHLLALVTTVESAFIAAALVAGFVAPSIHAVQYVLLILLAVAMAHQNTMALALAVPELKTTVLTLTLTGLAADSAAGAGMNARPGRRVVAVLTMFLGALAGGLLALHISVSGALALALLVTMVCALVSYLLSRSQPRWVRPVSAVSRSTGSYRRPDDA